MGAETQGREASEPYANSDAGLCEDLEEWANQEYKPL
jgi:hypothetical protein